MTHGSCRICEVLKKSIIKRQRALMLHVELRRRLALSLKPPALGTLNDSIVQ